MIPMRVVVEVPASTANLGPGLDALGLALDIKNRYVFTAGEDGPDIEIYGEGEGELPTDHHHPGYRACMECLAEWQVPIHGLSIRQTNHVPYSGGLGNSATAVVAGLLAAYKLADRPIDTHDILQKAARMEGHPDNVVPAYLGGLSVSVVDASGRIVTNSIKPPDDLQIILTVPRFTLSTSRSRKALPAQVPLKDALYNVGRTGLLVTALSAGRYDLLGEAMDDRLHQPYRAALVPGLMQVCRAARAAGAAGAALSGSGPTVLAFCCRHQCDPDAVGQAMVAAFAENNIPAYHLVVEPNYEGAVVFTTSSVAVG
ncbi:MAG TPA: homoserine kinase [Firmicutes bacterium]|nr:homoserine kinase [Bacillota bacterium]